MPAISFSDQPSVGRIRLTTTRSRRAAGEVAQLDQAAREPGEADRVGVADHHAPRRPPRARPASSGCGRAASRSPRPGSSSRLNPVSTTTCPCSRARLQQVLEGAGPDLDPAVGARQPGHHGQVRVDAALHRGEPLRELAGRGQPGRGEQPGDLVEDAELLGDGTAVGVGVDEHGRAAGAGRARRRAPMASVVRPGAPAGPQTAITRPPAPGAAGGTGAAPGGRGRSRGGVSGRRRSTAVTAPGSESRSGRRPPAAAMPIREARSRRGVGGRPRGSDRDRADAVAAQVVGRGEVEPGRVEAERPRRRPGRPWPRPAGRRRPRTA